MKKLLLFLLILLPFLGYSQVTTFNLDTLAQSGNDILSPGRGMYSWSGQYQVSIPYLTTTPTQTAPLDIYYRYWWSQFENATKNVYNWSAFDAQINAAISKGAKFSFCIMPVCVPCGQLTYPSWLHTAMQGESVKDWLTPVSNTWQPNYNSPTYLAAWDSLNVNLNRHINNTSFNGVPYKNVIYFIDMSGFGSYGEWQNSDAITSPSSYPTGTAPSVATFDSLLSYQFNVYNNFWGVMLPGTLDGHQLGNTWVDPAVGVYASKLKNNMGAIGYRRDNYGDPSGYIDGNWGINNPIVSGGVAFDTVVSNRYKYAPVTGEPIQDGNPVNGCDYGLLLPQFKAYHVTSCGNGNYSEYTQTCMIANVVAASKAMGYRYRIKTGTITTTISPGGAFALTLNWQNTGIAATYEKWNVQFELRNGATVLQTWTSSFSPFLFWQTAQTVTDNFTMGTTVPTGTYGLYMIIRDPVAYRKPLPLSNVNRQSDGSYLLTNVTVSSNTGNPIANAGPNQAITLPATLTLNGTGSSGTITSSTWTTLSGPNAPTITSPSSLTSTVTGLTAGTYIFKLTLNGGSSANDTVVVTAHTPPLVNAGSNQSVNLPVTVTLSGMATVYQGVTISGYLWTKLSGGSATITSPNSATTTLTGLAVGSYQFKLTVTDSYGSTGSANVTIVVNAHTPPTVNAGSNQNIYLPTTLVLSGSATAFQGTTITSYAWTQSSGPNTATIVSASSASTSVTGIIAGTYVFQLQATDSYPASNTSPVTIVVNNSATPVANAGANQAITVPTTSVTLNGSGSTGTVTSYTWTQVSGPNTATLATPNAVTTTASGLVPGTYVFKLSLNGTASTSTTQVMVSPAAVVKDKIIIKRKGNRIITQAS
jgi:hypothetical protein